jgi:hypothetical protein
MKWKDILSDKPSRAHRDQVLKAVSDELAILAENREVVPFWRRRFVLGALTLTGVTFFAVRFLKQQDQSPIMESDEFDLVTNFEDADVDYLVDLELFEDLDVLESWEG